jgi:hypothetical protein
VAIADAAQPAGDRDGAERARVLRAQRQKRLGRRRQRHQAAPQQVPRQLLHGVEEVVARLLQVLLGVAPRRAKRRQHVRAVLLSSALPLLRIHAM